MNTAQPNRYTGTPLRDPLILEFWALLSKEQRAALLDMHHASMGAVTLGDIALARRELTDNTPEYIALPARFRIAANLNACPCCATGKGLHTCYGPGVGKVGR